MSNLPPIQVKAGYDPLATGEYDARLVSIEAVDGQYGTQVRFTFELTDSAHSGRRLTAYARLSDSVKGKLAQYVGALMGRPLQAGEFIDWQILLNRTCRLVVLKAVKPDGTTYNKVEGVLPAPAQPTPAPQPAQAPEGQEGDPFA
jgi:hypothetical protein